MNMDETTNSSDDDDIQRQYFAAKDSVSVLSTDVSPPRASISAENTTEGKMTTEDSAPIGWREKMWKIYKDETLLIEVALAIVLAYIYPPLGAKYLYPDITAHWIAVIVIFFLSGFTLKVEDLSNAASNVKFNILVMLYNFLIISSVVNFAAKFLANDEVISEDLMKGMVICSCLSMPSNMTLVLTIGANGDGAATLFLALTMNLLGVFVTPLLIFLYLREDGDIDFVNTYKTISMRVLLPIGVGLAMRYKIAGADAFADLQKELFLKVREKSLVYIVYATFCSTFIEESESTASQILIMALSQIILLGAAMIIAWIFLFILFNRQPRLRVSGLFCCTTKTAALGIPLISAIYEDHPKIGIYTLPLLIWYPAQLLIGTALSRRLSRFVDYKLNKYELERQLRQYQLKGCGLLGQPSWA